jgi:putative heme iron utilization protein
VSSSLRKRLTGETISSRINTLDGYINEFHAKEGSIKTTTNSNLRNTIYSTTNHNKDSDNNYSIFNSSNHAFNNNKVNHKMESMFYEDINNYVFSDDDN